MTLTRITVILITLIVITRSINDPRKIAPMLTTIYLVSTKVQRQTTTLVTVTALTTAAAFSRHSVATDPATSRLISAGARTEEGPFRSMRAMAVADGLAFGQRLRYYN